MRKFIFAVLMVAFAAVGAMAQGLSNIQELLNSNPSLTVLNPPQEEYIDKGFSEMTIYMGEEYDEGLANEIDKLLVEDNAEKIVEVNDGTGNQVVVFYAETGENKCDVFFIVQAMQNGKATGILIFGRCTKEVIDAAQSDPSKLGIESENQ